MRWKKIVNLKAAANTEISKEIERSAFHEYSGSKTRTPKIYERSYTKDQNSPNL